LNITSSISDTNGAGGFILGTDAVGASTGDLYLNGPNSYSGPTIVTNQTLYVGAGSSLGNSSLILVANPGVLNVTSQATFSLAAGQTMAGDGTVAGNTVALGSNATLAPGLGGSDTSALTLNGAVTLSSGSTNKVVVNKTTSVVNSKVSGLTSVSMAGTLVVNSVGNALAAGDAIPLFSALNYSGGFATITPSIPGTGLAWNTSTLTTDGTLRVAIGVNPIPTNIVISASSGQLTFSWPSDHTGWTLQAQTNGFSGTWFDVPGSAATNQIFTPIDRANHDVFYRLILHP
jgi:autotransporter-associated beta strand protein